MEAPRPGDTSPPRIVLNGVTKTFAIKHTQSMKETFVAKIRGKQTSSKFEALKDLTFSVPEGQSVAVMGHNGSGKSTTLKLLSGVMQPDGGWVRTRGTLGGLLEVGAGFHPDLSGRKNVYLNAAILGMSREEVDAKFDAIQEFAEIGEYIDTEVKFYSSGMYARLGFAVAIHTQVDTLLVDEVLAVGDANFANKCMDRLEELKERNTTMFIVSHNAKQVKRLCERGIVLDHGRKAFDGPIDEAVEFMREHNRR
nr:ABC transporter ATP-binding protein [Canibacter zhoujuaniae]